MRGGSRGDASGLPQNEAGTDGAPSGRRVIRRASPAAQRLLMSELALAYLSNDQGLATVERSPRGSPRYLWRIRRRTILPLCVFGNSGTMTTSRGRKAAPKASATVALTAAGST